MILTAVEICLIVINIITFALYGIDKKRAIRSEWRISEKTLLGMAFAGGSVGALFGMMAFHHKTKHLKFRILVPFFLILHIVLLWFLAPGTPDGSDLESREEILNQLSDGDGLQIASEVKIDDWIISAIYRSQTEEAGIAVFEPLAKGKYKLQSSLLRQQDEIVWGQAIIRGTWYDLFWLNKPNLRHAEIRYTIGGIVQEPMIKEADRLQVLYCEAPEEDYSIHIAYYDGNGTKYE